jgi:hypothetical protein
MHCLFILQLSAKKTDIECTHIPQQSKQNGEKEQHAYQKYTLTCTTVHRANKLRLTLKTLSVAKESVSRHDA